MGRLGREPAGPAERGLWDRLRRWWWLLGQPEREPAEAAPVGGEALRWMAEVVRVECASEEASRPTPPPTRAAPPAGPVDVE